MSNQEIEDPKWITIPSYTECKGGSSRVGVAVRNLSKKLVIISKGQHVANVTAANQVPNMLAPKYMDKKLSYDRAYDNSQKELVVVQQSYDRADSDRDQKLWDQLDISGADSWREDQKQLVRENDPRLSRCLCIGIPRIRKDFIGKAHDKDNKPQSLQREVSADTSASI